MSTNFALTAASPNVNVIQSLNYLLATQANSAATTANVNYNGNVLVANTVTGTITGVSSTGQPQTNTISYLYGYIDVAYANTATGGGFTSNCTNQQYFGVHNSQTPSFDTNPVDYQWTRVAGGFGTNKYLYYTTGGGNTINFSVGTSVPSIYYSPVIDSTPILLASLANSIVTTTSILPGAVVGNVIAANTITGYNVEVGSLYANLFVANSIFVGQSLQSVNSTFDSPTSAGFWLDASNGSARFGGNISIGNNLTIGTNANVGNNLFVGNNAQIGGNISIGNNLTIGTNANVGNNLTIGTNANVGNNLFVGNNAQIGGNLNVSGLISTGNLTANTVQTTTIIPNGVSTQIFNSTSRGQNSVNISQNTVYYFDNQSTTITPTLSNQQILVTATANYSLELGGTGLAQPQFIAQLIMQYTYEPLTPPIIEKVQLATLWSLPILLDTAGGNTNYIGAVSITAAVTIPGNYTDFIGGVPSGGYSFYIGLEYITPYSSSNQLIFQNGTVSIQNLYR